MVHPLLVCRLLSTFAFQGRVGVIVRTLYHAAPALSHLLVVLAVVGGALSFMAHIVLGSYVRPVSSLGGALADTFGTFSGFSAIRDFSAIIPPSMEMLGVQKLAAALVLVAQTLLVVFVLLSFFFAILRNTLLKLRASRAFVHGPTLWQDLAGTVLPDTWAGAQRWSRKLLRIFGCGHCLAQSGKDSEGQCAKRGQHNRPPPLTNRQVARIVRSRALDGADVRPVVRRDGDATMVKVRIIVALGGGGGGFSRGRFACQSP